MASLGSVQFTPLPSPSFLSRTGPYRHVESIVQCTIRSITRSLLGKCRNPQSQTSYPLPLHLVIILTFVFAFHSFTRIRNFPPPTFIVSAHPVVNPKHTCRVRHAVSLQPSDSKPARRVSLPVSARLQLMFGFPFSPFITFSASFLASSLAPHASGVACCPVYSLPFLC